MERKSSKECSVFLVTKSSFDEFNNVFFMAERKMSCFEIHSRQRGFGRLFKYIFYSKVKKITFLKGIVMLLTSRFSWAAIRLVL